MTTRFPSGITTAAPNENLGNFILPDMTKAHVYFNDFDTYTAADWTVTEVGTATQALANVDGGVLLITNSAADNDASFSQKVGESFLLEVGKKAWFKIRFATDDVAQTDIVAGLQIADTTPLAVTDGVYFFKADGSANIVFTVIGNSVATTSAPFATLVAGDYSTLGFYYDGKQTFYYFAEDVLIGTVAATNMPATELTVSFGIQNGQAVASTMSVDFIMAAKER